MKKSMTKKLAEGGRIVANFGIENTNHSYFSITGKVYEKYKKEPWCCGCIHDEISENFPELRKFLPIHLSDAETGEPMYPIENGIYLLANKGKQSCMNHFRCTEEQYFELIKRCNETFKKRDTVWHFVEFYKENAEKWEVYSTLKSWLDEMGFYSQWKREADEFKEFLASV